MSNQVSFSPEVKKVTSKSNGNIEVLLIVSNASLQGKFDDLSAHLGKTVTVVIQPETYEYKIPYDKQTNKPNLEYKVYQDGTAEILKEEQTSLELGDGAPEVEERTFQIDKDLIDEFILSAPSLQYPESISINPRGVLDQIKKGIHIKDIAEENEMSEYTLLNEIEIARQHFAPFADAWHKSKVGFNEEKEETDSDNLPVEDETKKNDADVDPVDDDKDGEVDPY